MLTRGPHRRPARRRDGLRLAPCVLLLRDQPAEVAARAGVPGRHRDRQQPFRGDPAICVGDLARDQAADTLVVGATSDPSGRGLLALQHAFDGLVGDPADRGGPPVGADLVVGVDDVQLLPRRQQWEPPWAVTGDWLDTATVTAQGLSSSPTRRTRSGYFSWPPAGTSHGHHWVLSHGHGHSVQRLVSSSRRRRQEVFEGVRALWTQPNPAQPARCRTRPVGQMAGAGAGIASGAFRRRSVRIWLSCLALRVIAK